MDNTNGDVSSPSRRLFILGLATLATALVLPLPYEATLAQTTARPKDPPKNDEPPKKDPPKKDPPKKDPPKNDPPKSDEPPKKKPCTKTIRVEDPFGSGNYTV